MRDIEQRLARLEAERLGGEPADVSPVLDEVERLCSAAWAKAQTDEDGPFGTRAAALLALQADLERDAVAALARRGARSPKR